MLLQIYLLIFIKIKLLNDPSSRQVRWIHQYSLPDSVISSTFGLAYIKYSQFAAIND